MAETSHSIESNLRQRGKHSIPSPEYLRTRLRYEPTTGKLFWREHPDMPKKWNTRYAGTEAFTADNGKGYKFGGVNSVRFYAHRVIFAMHHGAWPDGEIDHIDGRRSNNRITNLRVVDSAGNNRNLSRRHDNTSGVTGVYWCARDLRWMAHIRTGGKTTNLGTFKNFEDAVAARKTAEVERGFSPNHGVTAP